MDELDRLKELNADRIKQIEEKYFQKKDSIQQVKEILQERAELREHKEKHVDSSLSYPTYGRGLDPNPDIDTYMINRNLCAEGTPKKKSDEGKGGDSPITKREKMKRPKIISPKRQKFETQFEKYMIQKHVEEKVTQPEIQVDVEKFDLVTKLVGSQNVKVQEKYRLLELEKEKKKHNLYNKNFEQLETVMEDGLRQETEIILAPEIIQKMKEIFDFCKDKESDHEVDIQTLLGTIGNDESFEGFMQEVVRETVDGDEETLENLFTRVLTDYQEDTVTWNTFVGFFTKRGKLRGPESPSPSKKSIMRQSPDKANN